MKNLNIKDGKKSSREVSAAAWDRKMNTALQTISAAEYRLAHSTNETIIFYANADIAKARKVIEKLQATNPYEA
jgi:hypothetical protein